MRSKTTCKVTFEDYAGNLRSAKVRVPAKASFTQATLVKMIQHKTGARVASVFGVECAYVGKGRRGYLPHKPRR
jgi:hypothetical protein